LLTLDQQAVLEYGLGDPDDFTDRIDVQGDLTLDGVLNITDIGGLSQDATYVLMTYTGELTDNGLQLGDVPVGFSFRIDTSVTGEVLLTPACPGDLTGDDVVGGADLGVLLLAWSPTAGSAVGSPADLNGDGRVDGADLGTLLLDWGPCQ